MGKAMNSEQASMIKGAPKQEVHEGREMKLIEGSGVASLLRKLIGPEPFAAESIARAAARIHKRYAAEERRKMLLLGQREALHQPDKFLRDLVLEN